MAQSRHEDDRLKVLIQQALATCYSKKERVTMELVHAELALLVKAENELRLEEDKLTMPSMRSLYRRCYLHANKNALNKILGKKMDYYTPRNPHFKGIIERYFSNMDISKLIGAVYEPRFLSSRASTGGEVILAPHSDLHVSVNTESTQVTEHDPIRRKIQSLGRKRSQLKAKPVLDTDINAEEDKPK